MAAKQRSLVIVFPDGSVQGAWPSYPRAGRLHELAEGVGDDEAVRDGRADETLRPLVDDVRILETERRVDLEVGRTGGRRCHGTRRLRRARSTCPRAAPPAASRSRPCLELEV